MRRDAKERQKRTRKSRHQEYVYEYRVVTLKGNKSKENEKKKHGARKKAKRHLTPLCTNAAEEQRLAHPNISGIFKPSVYS